MKNSVTSLRAWMLALSILFALTLALWSPGKTVHSNSETRSVLS